MSDHAIALAGLIAGAFGALAAVIALIYAHRAHRESVESNDIAAEASKLARNANEIAAREEARETEPHDVFWEGDWDPLQPGRYSLRKRGDAATVRELRRQQRSLPSRDTHDPGYRRLRYIRYADLCRARHKSAYAEARIMPRLLVLFLARAVSGFMMSA